jgi:hypothetical protein
LWFYLFRTVSRIPFLLNKMKTLIKYIYTFSEVFKQIIYIFTYYVFNYKIILNIYSAGII